MAVNPASAPHENREGRTYYFCGGRCRKKFLSTTVAVHPREPAHDPVIYTCPMHPEVEQDHPGACPKCGMALEPKTVTADGNEAENIELHDMTRRFWIGAVLTLPVFIMAMSHLVPKLAHGSWANSDISLLAQFALSTPVVAWAGSPFFVRGWRSIMTRHLNMFTLISIGVGAA